MTEITKNYEQDHAKGSVALTVSIVNVQLLHGLLVVGYLQELVQINVIDAALSQRLWVVDTERTDRRLRL